MIRTLIVFYCERLDAMAEVDLSHPDGTDWLSIYEEALERAARKLDVDPTVIAPAAVYKVLTH
jgi:hypothetical protein